MTGLGERRLSHARAVAVPRARRPRQFLSLMYGARRRAAACRFAALPNGLSPAFIVLAAVFSLTSGGRFARAATPTIYLIQTYSTNQVLVHFDTEANRTYTLQFTDRSGSNGIAGSTWSNLYQAPLTPFPDHYIVPDTRTNRMRFYRLSVTP